MKGARKGVVVEAITANCIANVFDIWQTIFAKVFSQRPMVGFKHRQFDAENLANSR